MLCYCVTEQMENEEQQECCHPIVYGSDTETIIMNSTHFYEFGVGFAFTAFCCSHDIVPALAFSLPHLPQLL